MENQSLKKDSNACNVVNILKSTDMNGPDLSQNPSPNKPLISKLKDMHQCPIAVLGAGPSLPHDIKQIPEGTIKIGVNDHADSLVDLDYICFCDHPILCERVALFLDRYEGRRVSFNKYSDWIIDVPYFWHGKTFGFAVWFAEWLGATEIILCGFDCHVVAGHFYTPVESRINETVVYDHLTTWRKVQESAIKPDRIKAVSGILIDYFGKYKG